MIGVSSTRFCEQDIEDTLSQVSKEFEHLEIISEGEHYLPLILNRFGNIARSYDLRYSIHAPISDVNIASLSERMREASTLELMAAMEHAISLNVKMITIHPGMYSFAVSGQESKSISKAKLSLRTLDRVTSEFGITMAVENMPSFGFMLGRKAEDMEELLEGTDLKMCFDIGHANTTNSINEMVDRLGDRIVNVHIHDNTGGNDDHMTIGDGNIDFPSILKRLGKYKGNMIIESRSLASAAESKEKLKKML